MTDSIRKIVGKTHVIKFKLAEIPYLCEQIEDAGREIAERQLVELAEWLETKATKSELYPGEGAANKAEAKGRAGAYRMAAQAARARAEGFCPPGRAKGAAPAGRPRADG